MSQPTRRGADGVRPRRRKAGQKRRLADELYESDFSDSDGEEPKALGSSSDESELYRDEEEEEGDDDDSIPGARSRIHMPCWPTLI
jgi:hypothetical protein